MGNFGQDLLWTAGYRQYTKKYGAQKIIMIKLGIIRALYTS